MRAMASPAGRGKRKNQTRVPNPRQIETGEDVWITRIADRLWLLRKDAGLSIPVLDRVIRMADDYLERWESELLERNGLKGAL